MISSFELEMWIEFGVVLFIISLRLFTRWKVGGIKGFHLDDIFACILIVRICLMASRYYTDLCFLVFLGNRRYRGTLYEYVPLPALFITNWISKTRVFRWSQCRKCTVSHWRTNPFSLDWIEGTLHCLVHLHLHRLGDKRMSAIVLLHNHVRHSQLLQPEGVLIYSLDAVSWKSEWFNSWRLLLS